MRSVPPNDLIQEGYITPFNIGRRIILNDFTAEELAHFAKGLNRDLKTADELMERIYYWSNGHPYLTQRLCKELAEDQNIQFGSQVDDLCNRLFLSSRAREEDDNLIFVRESLVKGEENEEGLLRFYEYVRNGDDIEDDGTNIMIKRLELTGIVLVQDGKLRVRNRISERIFDCEWVQRQLHAGNCAVR